MIIFKKIKYKNFLSTGNNWIEIDLNKDDTTLVVGQNGAGKSTMLDALSFALFGKSHRAINKPQLVNSVNQKGCEVIVELSIGEHEFMVKRGIKPNIFEIWQNSVMINQDAASRDYQKYLEQNILKLNHKSFHQIVVLGSSSFIPFMKLSVNHRREVIEDLLDIQIFGKMNTIVKERDSGIKDTLKVNSYNSDLTEEKITVQRKYIKDINDINSINIKNKNIEITNAEKEIEILQGEIAEYTGHINNETPILDMNLQKQSAKKKDMVNYLGLFKGESISLNKEIEFFNTNDTCPTCTSDIPNNSKRDRIATSTTRLTKLEDAISIASNDISNLEISINDINDSLTIFKNKTNIINSHHREIMQLNGLISNCRASISSFASGDITGANIKMRDLIEYKNKLLQERAVLGEERLYNSVITEMLKDTGIKTKVIKQYLEPINTMINKYLQVLDFFVSFTLDENFSETIKSRHRNKFNYSSFSEGEKQRIDLALLFTWRHIANMKNSISTNLLILDETFDSSLDHDGIENLMRILYTLDEGTNVFVISHKGDLLDGKFRNKLEFVKDNNFSRIKV